MEHDTSSTLVDDTPAPRKRDGMGKRSLPSAVFRLVVAVGLGSVLLSLIVRETLPGPLSRYAPDLALKLNSAHPIALVNKAESLRERLQEVMANEEAASRDKSDPSPDSKPLPEPASATAPDADAKQPRRPRVDRSQPEAGAGRFANPNLLSSRSVSKELATIRDEIATLARQAIAAAPVNASAYRLLGEVTTDRNEVRRLMAKAVHFSRRETFALAWLLADAADRKDMRVIVEMADSIMRTRPELTPAIAQHAAVAIKSAEGRKLFVAHMADDPPWRETLLRAVVNHLEDLTDLLSLMTAVAATPTPPTIGEVRSFIADALTREVPYLAHDAWRILVPRQDTTRRGELHNERFDREFTGYAFDWVPYVEQGASIDQTETEPGRKALRVAFDGSRVKAFSVRQVLLLSPGMYRLTGRYRGWLAANRGLRWQLRCLYGTREVLGQTELLMKTDGSWDDFDLQFQVIDVDPCKAQMLIVIHDSRSASEEVVSGEMQFDEFGLVRTELQPPDPAASKGTPEMTSAAPGKVRGAPATPPPPAMPSAPGSPSSLTGSPRLTPAARQP